MWSHGCCGRRVCLLCVPLGGCFPAFACCPDRSPAAAGPARPLAVRAASLWLGASPRCPARPRHPRAPRQIPPAPSMPVGPGVLACGSVRRLEARLWLSISNFACNSPANLSNHELTTLGLQRFQPLLKLHPIELHATFLGVVTAVTRCSLWRPSRWCGLLCCCVCYSCIQLVFGTKFAMRGLLVVTAVESSPCVACWWWQR